jgi:hypothetical protein
VNNKRNGPQKPTGTFWHMEVQLLVGTTNKKSAVHMKLAE